MGNLLNLLTDRNESPKYDVFLDFEDAQPKAEEMSTHQKVLATLERSSRILEELRSYEGAGEQIRQAISNPKSDDFQQSAWRSVCPLVAQLKSFYEHSLELEKAFVVLLEVLTTSDLRPLDHLREQQALVKQFAEILHFTLTFDDLKMTNPSIQNDFSYYRRTLNKMKMSNDVREGDKDPSDLAGVSNEMANRMSLFYAYPTPVLKTLSEATAKFVEDHKDLPIDNTTECLSTMATVCKIMIENPEYKERLRNEESALYCLRVMVGVIILYDHVHPVGAFAKKAAIDIRGSIKVLRDYPVQSQVESLINALRYTTKHLNDETTPKLVKSLLAE
ncbi:CYFIP-related Rac1 interactor B-like [Oscarella lobularis]|uniref:CYFIP-related Rac1 interactor B-like n=1 Tax=Oscarella lobularis TaxID=121494 RepID=UPI0033138732